MNRLLITILIASLAGCSVSSKHRYTATLGGSAIAVAGLFIARPKAVDSDHDGTNDFFLNDDYSGLIPGALLFAGGLALLIAGLNARDPEPAVQAPSPQPPFQPSFAPPGAVVSKTPLPEIAVTFEVLQLAKQIRAAAAHGHCDAALSTWARVVELDAGYATALRDGPVLAACAQAR